MTDNQTHESQSSPPGTSKAEMQSTSEDQKTPDQSHPSPSDLPKKHPKTSVPSDDRQRTESTSSSSSSSSDDDNDETSNIPYEVLQNEDDDDDDKVPREQATPSPS